MDSDEEPTIADPTEAAWASAQRKNVVEYLAAQRVEHAGVSLEPRWFLSPYVAIWAVRSKVAPDRIGWWAISGDLPTDYLTCTTEVDEADVLFSFSRAWKAQAARMAAGHQSSFYRIGPADQAKELAPMLLTRAELLDDFAREIKSGGPSGQG